MSPTTYRAVTEAAGPASTGHSRRDSTTSGDRNFSVAAYSPYVTAESLTHTDSTSAIQPSPTWLGNTEVTSVTTDSSSTYNVNTTSLFNVTSSETYHGYDAGAFNSSAPTSTWLYDNITSVLNVTDLVTDWEHSTFNSTAQTVYQTAAYSHYQSTAAMDGVRIVVEGVSGTNISNSTGLYQIPTQSNGTLDPPYKDFYETAQFATGLIVYPTICLYGLIGNILILIVLSQKSMSTSTNVYLSALAISDIIKLLNDSLYFLTILLMHTDPIAGNKCYGYLYPYAHFFVNLSVCSSAWLTVSVAVERYLLVCHPARSKSLITIPRAKIISFICFFVMTSLALPSVLRYQTVEKQVYRDGKNFTELDVNLTELWQNDSFVLAYTWVQSLLRSIIPLFVLIAMNTFIINALRKTRANKRMAQRNKITIMLLIVIIFFLVCITPDAIMSAFFNFGYTESDNYLVRGVREITDSLLAVNAAMNFTLYIIFNKIFREQFLEIFCKRCHKPSNEDEEKQYRRLSDAKPQTAHVHANGVSLQPDGTDSTAV